MALTRKQLETVCLIQAKDGRRCRYLGNPDDDPTVWVCGKLNKSHKAIIDAELEEELKELARKGMDPKKEGIPTGDNCQGYPLLATLPQGFDVKTRP